MENNNKYNSRRKFFKSSALLGGGAFVASTLDPVNLFANNSERTEEYDYFLNNPENILYSACLNCNTGCGIKCKIENGVLSKIDGNPYNPWTMVPQLPMISHPDEASKVDGGLCPKGQSGIQIAYDPYRIRKVLKRAGKRGENKWQTIDFSQAITEIVEGGKLFSHVAGEENREVEGLKSIMALTDKKIAKAMAADVKTMLTEKDEEKRNALISEFKIKFANNLDKLIDSEHPDLGPKNNQFVMSWGRLKGGRKNFFKYLGKSLGTTNMHGHTTVCQGSLYFTCQAISEKYVGGKFTDGSKFYWQADIENSKYILFVGANLFDANYGPTNRTVRLTENLKNGITKIGVVDPRFSKLASKAETWLPIKPGTDAALALAITQWIMSNERYDANFLKCANKAAATESDETSWCNATHLVVIKDGVPGKMLRAADLGIIKPETRTLANGEEYKEKFLTVFVDGKPVAIDPSDEKRAVYGDLFVDTELTSKDGEVFKVKSSLQILKESANQQKITEWCEIAGLPEKDVLHIAKQLTSYGKQAAVDIHRGPAQHTNGFYNVLAWMSINMLLGNYDWKGGMSKASTYKHDDSKGGPYNLKEKSKIDAFGISSIRHGQEYEKTSIFEGYPSKRNWFPLSSDIYEEIIPSIGDKYPYPVKALFMYMGAPTYALPAGHTNIEVLTDVGKLPLFFTSDIVIGPTSMYSDYIFPDLSYLERWEFQGSHPNMPVKVEVIRQPVIAPLTETVKIFDQEVPISLESLFMAIGEKLGLETFGKDAFGEGLDFKIPDDFYIRAITNIAVGEGGVSDANARELEIFEKSRKHLPNSVYNLERWKKLAGEEHWAKVVYILNRGGRFQEHDKAYSGNKLKNGYKNYMNMYQEKTATKKYSGTGKNYSGIAQYIEQKNFAGESLSKMGDGYDLHLITSRTISQTKSRTIGAYWLQALLPENGIIINTIDAHRLDLKNDDLVKVVSSTNTEGKWDFKNGKTKDIIGKVVVTENIRPGVISFYLGFGHWATGANDFEIDNVVIKGDKRRAKGVHANAAMWTDGSLRNNTCLLDPVGGSVSFYDTKVKLVKV